MRYHPNVTYNDVVTALKQEEVLLHGRKSTSGDEGALLASSNRFSKQTCNNCGKRGHIMRQCKQAARSPAASSDKPLTPPSIPSNATRGASNFNYTCYNCGEKGHKKPDCTKERKPAVGAVSEVVEFSDEVDEVDIDSKKLYALAMGGQADFQCWVIDSGASRHMSFNRSLFNGSLIRLKSPVSVRVGNGTLLQADFVGTIQVKVKCEGSLSLVDLHNVLFVPDLHFNLFSITKCTEFGHSVTFVFNSVVMTTLDGVRFCDGHRKDGLWYLSEWTASINSPLPEIAMLSQVSNNSNQLWHKRFCHLGAENVSRASSIVEGMP